MTVCQTGDQGTWTSYAEIFHQLTGTWIVYEMPVHGRPGVTRTTIIQGT